MSDNIIAFPQPDDGSAYVWVCLCGCTVHYHRANGDVECSACGSVGAADSGEWREKLPDPPPSPKVLDESNFKVVDVTNGETFLKRQAKAAAGRPVAVAVVAYSDGALSTFGADISGDARREWARRKLEEAAERLTRP